MQRIKFSLQKKITISIVSIIFLFGIIASIVTFIFTSNDFTNNLINSLTSNALIQGDETYQVLKQSQELAKLIASRPTIKQYFTDPTNKQLKKQLENNFLDAFNLNNMYSAIYLLDAEGIGTISTDSRIVGIDYSFRDYFVEAKDSNNYANIAIGTVTKELGYYFSSPIYDSNEEGRIVGVAVVKLKPVYVSDTVLDHVGTNFNVLIVDQNGIVIVASDQTKLLHSLGRLSEETLSKIEQNKTYNSMTISPLDYEPILKRLSELNDTPNIFRLTDKQDNIDEIISAMKIDGFPFYLIYEGNYTKIHQNSIRSSLIIAGSVLLAAFFTLLIIIIMVRKFLLPIDKLTNLAKDIGEGKDIPDMNIQTGDELQVLGEVMKDMAKKVVTNKLEIETKINERTSELKELNHLMVNRELKMLELKEKIKELEGKK